MHIHPYTAWLRLGILAAALLPCSSIRAAQIIHADGRRDTVDDPRADTQGRWTYGVDGRRVVLVPGEIVVLIDDAGKETVTIPELADAPDGPEVAALLASIRDPKNPAWMEAATQLGRHPTRSVFDALLALTNDAKKDTRRRGIGALAALRTRESVTAATAAILAEKDASMRREAASTLFAVQEIFCRCDAAQSVSTGITDKDGTVRFVFAVLAPPDLEDAKAVLRGADGLKHRDHHTRESAAVELGLRGDGAGESILIGMLARSKLPGFDAKDATLMQRYLIAEQVQVCEILGSLATAPGKAALEKARSSPHEAVRAAAAAALADD